MEFKEIVMKRYATKLFNGKIIPEYKISELLDIIRYAPSSFNIQPWKIKVITDKELKEKLEPHAYNQKQITTCSHLLVLCARTDVMDQIKRLKKRMVEKGIDEKSAATYSEYMSGAMQGKSEAEYLSWAQRQVYLALGNALNGAKYLGFDSCPMEGFDSKKFAEILELPKHLIPSVLCPVGYAADEQKNKLRFKKEDMFF
ncbi:MAG: NAD(P)H-dependent oxidoreductase [Nanoarchaeota archaeon]